MTLLDYFFGKETFKQINISQGILEEHIEEPEILQSSKRDFLKTARAKVLFQYIIPNTFEPITAYIAYRTGSPPALFLGITGLELLRAMTAKNITTESLNPTRRNNLRGYFTKKLLKKEERLFGKL